MKASKIILGLFILCVLTASAAYAQIQVIQTVTASNRDCNNTCSIIESPEINPISPPNTPANSGATLFITQIGTSNPHPIGVYYMYRNKWSVFNLDAQVIPVGAQFKVEYYTPDANHFVYSIPPRIHTTDPAYIDNVGLNNNPNAQIRVFPHCSATIGNIWNKEAVKVEYDATAAKWFIANLNGTPITPAVAYNVMFSQGYSVTNPNANKTLNTTPQTRVSNSGSKGNLIFPSTILTPQLAPPTVIVRAEWAVPSTPSTANGKPLIFIFGACVPMISRFTDPAILATDTVIVTGQANNGDQVTWTALADNGSIQIFACNNVDDVWQANSKTTTPTIGAFVNGKKVNILVLR